MKKLLIFITVCVVVLLVFLFFSPLNTSEDEDVLEEVNIYSSEDYDFSIEYPAEGWSISEAPHDVIAPKFSIYLDSDDPDQEGPFDHHYQDLTHVSVYPHGIPTEGVFGQTVPLPDDWGEDFSEESSIYVLEDGSPFAAYIKFKETPDSWRDSGFAWVRLRIDNKEVVCFRDGEEVGSASQCDPLGDESVEIVYRGDVNEDTWILARNIAESIEF